MNVRDLINSRLLALACILLIVIVLAACNSTGGGGSGGTRPEPRLDNCDSTSVLENGTCRTFAIREDTRATTPFIENGAPVTLEVVLFKPLTGSRFPTIMFNHGSTGNGSDPSLFDDTFISKTVSQYFTERGWMVAFPQRRGRGMSDGLYDEGFTPDRSGYSCAADRALAGAERALDDLDAAVDWLRLRTDVDTSRMLVGGTSRGGILSIAHIARRPDVYLTAINFVGGWIAEGCGDHRVINDTLFEDGAAFPGRTAWLYGRNDSFYSIGYSRDGYTAYTTAGGLGTFLEFERAPGLNGHFLLNDPALWAPPLDEFLGSL